MEEPAALDYAATMVGSAIAGMLGRLACHPIDTIKARLQVATTPSSGRDGAALSRSISGRLNRLLSTALQDGGLRGLYRGLGITFLGSAPGTVLYFTSYELARDAWASRFGGKPDSAAGTTWLQALGFLLSGFAAETVSCIFWVPIDVIKERMQVQVRPSVAAGVAPLSEATAAKSQGGAARFMYYKSAADAARKILASEGVSGIYRGYGATLASFGPFSALYFMLYENWKALALRLRSSESKKAALVASAAPPQLSLPWQIAVASAAGAAASILTNPLDLVKLRLQVQRGYQQSAAAAAVAAAEAGAAMALKGAAHVGGQPSPRAAAPPSGAAEAAAGAFPFQYSGIVDGLRQIVRHEGPAALLRGAGARVAFHVPSTAVTMTLFERCKSAARYFLDEQPRER